MSYWIHWHNVKYEISKLRDRAYIWLADHMPSRLRVWVVVTATNEARRMYPDPSGYAGPEGLGYKEIYDGAAEVKSS